MWQTKDWKPIMGVRSANGPAATTPFVTGLQSLQKLSQQFNEQDKWALDGLVLEGASENTIVANRHCWTAKEPGSKALTHFS